MKRKIATHMSGMSAPQKVAFSRKVVTSMTGNATFAAPSPPLAAITKLADDTEGAAKDADALHASWMAAVAKMHGSEVELEAAIAGEASYVQTASAGDEAKMKSSGFDLAAERVRKTTTLAAPTGLGVTTGDHATEVDAQWNPDKGAGSYLLQTADAADGPYTIHSAAMRSKATLTGLASGKKVWVRVATVNAVGTGAWSAPVEVTVA